MARQLRIEYAGAFYHVMARGDRREDIFYADSDRELFLKTLGETCERCGWRVHAWVLMGNHYHLLLETPEANLVVGMKWLQHTYTQRFNTRHRQWGHLFSGRYKAILVEQPGMNGDSQKYYAMLLDYIHLNPARAGLVRKNDGLLSYRWSSLAQGYGVGVTSRAKWQEVESGLQIFECTDDGRGRKKFVARLELMRRQAKSKECGRGMIDGQTLSSRLNRGWYWGGETFKEKLLLRLGKSGMESRKGCGADNFQLEHGESRAKKLIDFGLRHYGLSPADLARLPSGDKRKVEIAAVVFEQTGVSQEWLARQLAISTAVYVSQLISRYKKTGKKTIVWQSKL